ncbi:MAG TPA: PQQ-binding-like beta-propeller repeat protein [Solirubrobacteraceae bacterium]|jgi:polyvinyl alcohol dehydrogenase (cytochrome)
MRGALPTAVAFLALAVPGTAAADWPIYGHDLSNTRTAAADGPAGDELAGLQRDWTFRSPTGDFTGTPVVAGGVLVAGDHGGWVYALDAVTGEVRWTHEAGASINGTAAIDLAAPGGATVFVPVAEPGAPRLVALSLADGAKRWETVLTEQPNASVYGSPVFWNGSLYIGTSGPNNDDTKARGSVVALDEATGRVRWQTFTVPPESDGAAVWCTPAIDTATGRLYVVTGNNYHPPATDTSDAILALDASDGAIVGKYQATPDDDWSPDNLTGGPDHDFGASPNLFTGPDGRPLVGAGQKSGTYWAVDRATFEMVWNRQLGPGGILGGIMGSTAFDGTRIYGSNAQNGEVFGLGRDGTVAWTSMDSGGTHFGPTAVANGVVYTVDPSGFVVARDPESGAVLARLGLDGPAFGGVSAVGRALYVAVGTGPPPEPAPQQDGPGDIVAFGDTSASKGTEPPPAPPIGGGGTEGGQSPPPAARRLRLRLTVKPRRVRAGRRTILRFRVTAAGRPVATATIRVGRRLTVTDSRAAARSCSSASAGPAE